MQSNGTTEMSNRKPPPSSQDRGVVDVPGSHYCKPSELSRGSSTEPCLLFFYTRLWDHFECNLKILCCKYADLVIVFPWSACLLLPRCLPTLMGEQLLAAVYRPAQFLTLTRKTPPQKNAWKFSICSHRSFYISRRASQHNCSQLVASCQSYYGHQ